MREPWCLRSALTEIIGDGKLGKSLALLDLAAWYSLEEWDQPDVGGIAAEDAVEFVIRPRLRAIGANLDNIHFIDGLEQVDENDS